VDARVLAIFDAVLVGVGLGATIVVLEVVDVLDLVFALVGIVRDSILIVVELGAAITILESVHVLGRLRTRILVVRDAVFVAVEDGRVPGYAEEGARRRQTDPLERTGAAAKDEAQLLAQGRDLEASVDFDGVRPQARTEIRRTEGVRHDGNDRRYFEGPGRTPTSFRTELAAADGGRLAGDSAQVHAIGERPEVTVGNQSAALRGARIPDVRILVHGCAGRSRSVQVRAESDGLTLLSV